MQDPTSRRGIICIQYGNKENEYKGLNEETERIQSPVGSGRGGNWSVADISTPEAGGPLE